MILLHWEYRAKCDNLVTNYPTMVIDESVTRINCIRPLQRCVYGNSIGLAW